MVTLFTNGQIREDYAELDACRYARWQFELCPDTHRRHAHVYLEFEKPVRFSRIRDFYGINCHCEPVRDRQKSWEYCGKTESRLEGPYEWGTRAKVGRSAELDHAVEIIRSGGTLEKVAQQHPMAIVRNGRGLRTLYELQLKPRDRGVATEVVLLYGGTGTGKTRYVYEHFGSDLYVKMGENTWWDGYKGEDSVLIDDYGHAKKWEFGYLLRVLDRYPLRVEMKGSSVELRAHKFYITSNYRWEDWYPDFTAETLLPLKRRITKILRFTKLGEDPVQEL